MLLPTKTSPEKHLPNVSVSHPVSFQIDTPELMVRSTKNVCF